jgi:hypothetical protein
MNPPVFVRAQLPGSDLDKDIGYRTVFFMIFLNRSRHVESEVV